MLLHLHTSGAPYLQHFVPLALHTSTLLRLQRTFRTSRPSQLHASTSACLHVATPTSNLKSFMAPYLPVAPPTARLQSSIPLRGNTTAALLQRSPPPYLHVYTPTVRLRSSIPPCLPVATLATSLQTSRAPYFYVATSTHLQRT